MSEYLSCEVRLAAGEECGSNNVVGWVTATPRQHRTLVCKDCVKCERVKEDKVVWVVVVD
jgi:hypothetical protein